jgi:hypothetical protein
MDNAVSLVQSYLRLNGYFTVSEFPVVEADESGSYRTATDLDILAIRFPSAGLLPPSVHENLRARTDRTGVLDSALGILADQPDMIIGEVKEGRAILNEAATDPAVLQAVLVRFGCCAPAEAAELAQRILQTGQAVLPIGHRVRLVAFGALPGGGGRPPHDVILLGHALAYLQSYVERHWEVLRHTDNKDPAFGFLMTLEKTRRGVPSRGLKSSGRG